MFFPIVHSNLTQWNYSCFFDYVKKNHLTNINTQKHDNITKNMIFEN